MNSLFRNEGEDRDAASRAALEDVVDLIQNSKEFRENPRFCARVLDEWLCEELSPASAYTSLYKHLRQRMVEEFGE